MLSNLTSGEFVELLADQPNGLGSVVAVVVSRRRVTARTSDDHAAHAVEILAARKGLKTLTTRPDDGSWVIGITGFAK